MLDAVFDIQTSLGCHLQGAVRGLQLTDTRQGKSLVFATVKSGVTGEIVAPDKIQYTAAFDSISCDVLLCWRHNLFSQDLVFHELPELPAGWDPKFTKLEVVTEINASVAPELRQQSQWTADGANTLDDTVIHFPGMNLIMGNAWMANNASDLRLGSLNNTTDAVAVSKKWRHTPTGDYLVESLPWNTIQSASTKLPSRKVVLATPKQSPNSSYAFSWPRRKSTERLEEPMLVQNTSYRGTGLLLDFYIIPDSGTPTTLASDTTYYIKTSYYSGSAVTFQPRAYIKYKNNAYMLLYGSLTFPSSTDDKAVFTSRNDDVFGEKIANVTGEPNSDGDPTGNKAAQAIWIYYVNFSTTIRSAEIRWCKIGIQYNENSGVNVTHTISYCLFENIVGTGTKAIYNQLVSSSLVADHTGKCNVDSVGAMLSLPVDCGIVSTAYASTDASTGDPNKDSQSECSFVVVDSSHIATACFDTHLTGWGLGAEPFTHLTSFRACSYSYSTDGGQTFSTSAALPPTSPSSSQGDAGDSVMVLDPYGTGTIYLMLNPSRESSAWNGFRMWKSTDNGQTYSAVNYDIPGSSGVIKGDKPALAIDNYSSSGTYRRLYAAGYSLNSGHSSVTYSADHGSSWSTPHSLDAGSDGVELVVAPNGFLYAFYCLSHSLAYVYYNPSLDSWSSAQSIPCHSDSSGLYATEDHGETQLYRYNGAGSTDWFFCNSFPHAVANPVAHNDNIYLTFADLPSSGSTNNDHADIYLLEGQFPDTGGAITWSSSGSRRVNNDSTVTDQWNPSIAINPTGTELFIGYYSRQADTSNNSLVQAYGARINLPVASATIVCFPIHTDQFSILFAGSTTSSPSTSTWLYDAVWCQGGVGLDSYADYTTGLPDFTTDTTYAHFCGDDYTWAKSDDKYFYFAWCDRTQSVTLGTHTRSNPNIRFGKIRK